jgi:hypothetical protein
VSPVLAIDQQQGDALPFWELCQSRRQSRLDPDLFVGGPLEHRTSATLATATLPNAKEIAGRVRHRTDALPMLPGVRQGLGCGLAPDLSTAGGDEGAAKTRLDVRDEPTKLSFGVCCQTLASRNLIYDALLPTKTIEVAQRMTWLRLLFRRGPFELCLFRQLGATATATA